MNINRNVVYKSLSVNERPYQHVKPRSQESAIHRLGAVIVIIRWTNKVIYTQPPTTALSLATPHHTLRKFLPCFNYCRFVISVCLLHHLDLFASRVHDFSAKTSIMPALSLRAISTRVAIQFVRSMLLEINIHRFINILGLLLTCKGLRDVGNMPYSMARPILLKVESPAQLVSSIYAFYICFFYTD